MGKSPQEVITMYWRKANILFILKIATDLIQTDKDFGVKYYKEVFRAFKRFNKTGEHYYFKLTLSDNDLEKLGLTYLFFKEDMQECESRFKIIRIGDLFKEHLLFHDWNRTRTFDNLILFKRYLGHDKLYNVLYINKRQLKFIIDLEKRNKIKWYNITDQDREIIKTMRCFDLRYIKFINKHNIETIEDVKAITLKDVLTLIPIKTLIYEDWIRTNEQKIDIILTHYYEHCTVNRDIRAEFVYHLRKILIPLFEQTPQEEETTTEDYEK